MIKDFIAILLLILSGSNLIAEAAPVTSKRPNVILILADDLGPGDLGFYGNPKIKTPNLDRLARESTRFEYFYVSPVCSPTRASLMTGRYNFRTGVVDTALGRHLRYIAFPRTIPRTGTDDGASDLLSWRFRGR